VKVVSVKAVKAKSAAARLIGICSPQFIRMAPGFLIPTPTLYMDLNLVMKTPWRD